MPPTLGCRTHRARHKRVSSSASTAHIFHDFVLASTVGVREKHRAAQSRRRADVLDCKAYAIARDQPPACFVVISHPEDGLPRCRIQYVADYEAPVHPPRFRQTRVV